VKLKKLNDSTAVDEKGNGWFRYKAGERHSQWVSCIVCGKTVQYYWSDWPDYEAKVCDVCMVWEK